MLGLGLSIPRCAVRAGDALTREVASILAKYGTDAHVYLPGIGVINGLTAGNYLDSAGTTAATVDNPVGKVTDANGAISATQATTANKPNLSQRYNLLTKTEQFDNAAWTKADVSITPNAVTAPDGTLTSDLILETVTNANHRTQQALSIVAGSSVQCSIRFKQYTAGRNISLGMVVGASYVTTIFSSADGTVLSQNDVLGATISNKVNYTSSVDAYGFYTAKISIDTSGSTSVSMLIDVANGTSQAYAGDITKGLYVWGASLVPNALSSLPYQRVNTATDYDHDLTKFKYKWSFDATDVLTATYPAGYETATIVDAKSSGQVTLTAQNIVGTYNINTDTHGRLVFKTITAPELAIIQTFANGLAGH